MTTWNTDIATKQQTGTNFPGDSTGLAAPPSGTGFNDPAKELGALDQIIATYTFTGNEALSDIILIAALQQGMEVDPHGFVSGNGVATSCSISVGDNDAAGASYTRYSAAIDVSSGTADVATSGGAALVAPYQVANDCFLAAKITALNTVVAGKVLVFRLRVNANN